MLKKRVKHLKTNGATYKKPKFDPVARQCAVTVSFMTATELAEKSGLCYATAQRIITGKTYRPQNLTIDRLLFAAGFERKITKME